MHFLQKKPILKKKKSVKRIFTEKKKLMEILDIFGILNNFPLAPKMTIFGSYFENFLKLYQILIFSKVLYFKTKNLNIIIIFNALSICTLLFFIEYLKYEENYLTFAFSFF